jgi:hypothetical protein
MLRYGFETGPRGQLGSSPILANGVTRLTAPPVQDPRRCCLFAKIVETGPGAAINDVPRNSRRKYPIIGYSGFVPGYTSECQNYGKVWSDVVVENENRKEDAIKVLLFWQLIVC